MRTEDIHLVWSDAEVQSLLETTRGFRKESACGGELGKHKGQI